MIGDDVVVTIVEMRGEVARVGISAPRHVRVHREEIYREVANTNAASTTTPEKASELAAFVKSATAHVAPAATDSTPAAKTAAPAPVPSAPQGAPKPRSTQVAASNGSTTTKKQTGVPKPGPPKARKT